MSPFAVSTNVPKFTTFAHFFAGLLEVSFLTSRRSFLIRKIGPFPVSRAASIFSHELFFTVVVMCFCCAEVCDLSTRSIDLCFDCVLIWEHH